MIVEPDFGTATPTGVQVAQGHTARHSGRVVADCLRKKTDASAAAVFAERAHGVLLFNFDDNAWMHYNGTRWIHDRSGRAIAHGKAIAKHIARTAADVEDDEERRAGLGYALILESKGRLEAMVALAKDELAATNSDFDLDPYSLNVENGTLDLRTGVLRKHDPTDKITKIAPARYDPTATCPRWDQFLREVMLTASGETDDDLVAYLQVLIGYCLIGEVREHLLCICYGTGRNGKSTLLDVLLALFGDYGQASDTTLFTAQTQRGPCEEKARLKGVRLATASELPDGGVLAENTIKALTGGDSIVANFKYGHTFEFAPSHTFLVATNNKPIVRGDDPAIWGRLKLVPFTAYFPDDDPTTDRGLPVKLMAELPGILNWAVAGYRTYWEAGLPVPTAVRRATADYRADSDVIAAFIAEKCVVAEGCRQKASVLYEHYKQWHADSGESPKSLLTMRRFTPKLRERGFANHTANGIVFDGIGIRDLDHAERTGPNGTNEVNFHKSPSCSAGEEKLTETEVVRSVIPPDELRV